MLQLGLHSDNLIEVAKQTRDLLESTDDSLQLELTLILWGVHQLLEAREGEPIVVEEVEALEAQIVSSAEIALTQPSRSNAASLAAAFREALEHA